MADNLNNPNWLSLDNLAPDESGEVWFTNAAPSGVTSQFYRAVSQ
ncbi:MAG TPA: hypothetical protein VMF06_21145 [Candidatus Limnocylindria bacterium]|nr:hypothetical protein [Candidatus Limnocylindria bacterium]